MCEKGSSKTLIIVMRTLCTSLITAETADVIGRHRRLLIRFALGGIFITALATQPCGGESIGLAGISNRMARNSLGATGELDKS